MVGRIACFFTGGYTEAGGMQLFLGKVNDRYDFKQFMPNKTRKRKGDNKIIQKDFSGITGEAFVKKVHEILENPLCRKEISQCKAILLEDDLDGRFAGKREEWVEEYKEKIISDIQEKIGWKIPVFCLYASPEIEAWFIADWKNGLEAFMLQSNYITDIERNAKQYFLHYLKMYVQDNILKEYVTNIEDYGFFDGEYHKLSDELIDAVQTGVGKWMEGISGINRECLKQIQESRELYYAKKGRGEWILKNILPEAVAQGCRKYFRPVYNQLLNF